MRLAQSVITVKRCPQLGNVETITYCSYVPKPTHINVYLINTNHIVRCATAININSIINYNTIRPRKNKRACVDDNDAARGDHNNIYCYKFTIPNTEYKYLRIIIIIT